MGVIRRQAIYNTIFSYIGVGLGYINIILLFPNFFSAEQFGLIQLLISVAEIYALISALGLNNGITRFFPFYKTNDRTHNGFVTYIMLISLTGFSLVTLLYLLFRPLIISAYIKNSSMFIDYYFLLIPFSLFSLFFNVFEAVARAVYKTGFSTFIREVGLRVLTLGGILLFIFNILTFHNFVIYFIFIYLVCSLSILIQIIIGNEYSFTLSLKYLKKNNLKELLQYGGFTLISGAALQTGMRLPALMIGSMVGLAMVGVYNLYFYIATMIYIPMRALSRISNPVIAASWKENDTVNINDIYKRSSMIQLILGLLIYVGIIINKDNLFVFLKNPEYTANFIFFPVIALGVLIDVSVGLNSEIIVSSPKFKIDSLFNIILVIASIAGNFILIPLFGALGAAISFVIAYFIFNLLKWAFLYKKYNMQPFEFKHFYVLGIAILIYFTGSYIPKLNNVILDIIFRSSLVTIIYFTFIILLKISPDINERVRIYKKKFFK